MGQNQKTVKPASNYPIRLFKGILMAVALGGFLYWGFFFLRDSELPKVFTTMFAIVWGVGGMTMIYVVMNWLAENLLPTNLRHRVLPYVFLLPAMLLLLWFLVIPTLRTLVMSFSNKNNTEFIGFANYIAVFTERLMLEAFRNNLLWIMIGTTACIVFGLLVAVLADRSSFENIAKAIIFMPMAISFVGAGVIWKFVFLYEPAGEVQRGLLNAIWVGLGGQPQAWLQMIQPWNNLFLIMVAVWIQTGYAMVIFSSAIKSVPEEILEAARIDGATEIQAFFRITIPVIKNTIITVTTTIVIFMLKIFDVVIIMTGGQYGTEVIATQFYRQFFTNRNQGYGAAISIVLLIAVLPVMIYNLREFGKQETFR